MSSARSWEEGGRDRRRSNVPAQAPSTSIESTIWMRPRRRCSRPSASPEEGSLSARERTHIDRVIAETHFNLRRASEVLGISRSTLYKKLRLYEIEVPRKSRPNATR